MRFGFELKCGSQSSQTLSMPMGHAQALLLCCKD